MLMPSSRPLLSKLLSFPLMRFTLLTLCSTLTVKWHRLSACRPTNWRRRHPRLAAASPKLLACSPFSFEVPPWLTNHRTECHIVYRQFCFLKTMLYSFSYLLELGSVHFLFHLLPLSSLVPRFPLRCVVGASQLWRDIKTSG